MAFDVPGAKKLVSKPKVKRSKRSAWEGVYSKKEMKERFLVHYKESENKSQACRELKIARNTLTLWEKNDPAFKQAVKNIQVGNLRESFGPEPDVETTPVLESEVEYSQKGSKQALFINRYRKSRSRADACIYASIPASKYEDWRDPASQYYDAEFDDLMYSEERYELWAIEDGLINQAKSGNANNAQFILERRMRDQYGPPTKKKIHEHKVEHWFSRGGALRARDHNQEILDAVRQPDQIDSPSERPIDGGGNEGIEGSTGPIALIGSGGELPS